MYLPGILLSLVGLCLVAFATNINLIHVGAYLVLAGVVWLVLFMVFHAGYRDYQLTEFDFKRILKGEEIPVTFKRIGDWKSVLREMGVKMEDRRFTYKQPEFTNRVMGEELTSPIKLQDGKIVN